MSDYDLVNSNQDMQGGATDYSNHTEYQVNVGPKQDKGGPPVDAYPNTDDNRFFASGRDEKIISAKRKLRDGMK